MALLIKNAHVFAPTDLGKKDVLMVGENVVAIGEDLPAWLPDTEVIDAKGHRAFSISIFTSLVVAVRAVRLAVRLKLCSRNWLLAVQRALLVSPVRTL